MHLKIWEDKAALLPATQIAVRLIAQFPARLAAISSNIYANNQNGNFPSPAFFIPILSLFIITNLLPQVRLIPEIPKRNEREDNRNG